MDLPLKLAASAIVLLTLVGELSFEGFLILIIGGYLMTKHFDNIFIGAPVYT